MWSHKNFGPGDISNFAIFSKKNLSESTKKSGQLFLWVSFLLTSQASPVQWGMCKDQYRGKPSDVIQSYRKTASFVLILFILAWSDYFQDLATCESNESPVSILVTY